MDYMQMTLGERAKHVPVWMYLRNHGDGVVSFTGASKVEGENPLLHGSKRDVRFLHGDMVVRGATVVGTDIFQGYTTGQLLTNPHDNEGEHIDRMLVDGEYILRPQ